MSSNTVIGKIIKEEVIPARGYTAFTMKKGQILRCIDIEGKQVPDLSFYNLHDYTERYSGENTKLINGTFNPTTDHIIVSENSNTMLTIVEDTVGRNYAADAMCSEEVNYRRYGIRGTINCKDNLAKAVEPWGIKKHETPGCFVPFMYVKVNEDDSYTIEETPSRAGDYIDMRAEMDLLVGFSACPQENNPVNDYNPTPLKYIIYEKE